MAQEVTEVVQGDVEGYVSVIAKCFFCKVHRSLMNVANV